MADDPRGVKWSWPLQAGWLAASGHQVGLRNSLFLFSLYDTEGVFLT
jgi:hypothetical protein